jgi:hypothetical protein
MVPDGNKPVIGGQRLFSREEAQAEAREAS